MSRAVLANHVALVTGASGGLGAAIARGLAEAGADVACQYRSDAKAVAAVVRTLRRTGRHATSIRADVTVKGEVDQMIESVIESHGRLDILVNNAGIIDTSPFLQLSEDRWDQVLDTNLKGTFLVSQASAKVMASHKYGRIVNVSSSRQEQSFHGNSAYAASKGGIWMLNRAMALELAPHGIRVNSIAPGTIETDMNRSYLSDPEFRRRRIDSIPVGRLGTPADIVAAVVLLASPDADFITGATLMIDGGQTIW